MVAEVFEVFFVLALLIGALINTYTDIKGRWAPDYVNYGLIIIGIFGHLIQSVITKTYNPILFSLIGGAVFFVLANGLFYTGQCGGGDAKFWIALGTLLPLYPRVLEKVFSPAVAPWPFLVSLMMNIFVAGAFVGVFFAAASALKNKKIFKKEIGIGFSKNKPILFFALVSVAVPLFSFFVQKEFFSLSFFVWLMVLLAVLIKISSKAIEKSSYKKIKPSKLDEGDWTVDEIKINGKVFHKPCKTGIERKEILKLIKLERSGKINYVRVKQGFPFLVSFTVGILFSLVFGDLMIIILGTMV